MRTFPPRAAAFEVLLPRNGFGPRLAGRAGDVWRAMQDVVADHSDSVGWTPERFVAAGTMFVVRTMTVEHVREVHINEPLTGRTWPSRARRQMLFTRQVRLFSGHELVATASQEWAYLSREVQATRAGKELFDAYTIDEGYPEVSVPRAEVAPDAPVRRFSFTVWHGWMDSNGHANHTAYVDYCDEGVARIVAAEGGDAQALVPVKETVHFRAAVGAGDEVTVETTEAAPQDDARVFSHRILVAGKVCATATLVRRPLR